MTLTQQLEFLQDAFVAAAELKRKFEENGQEIVGAESARNMIKSTVEEIKKEIEQEKPGLKSRLFELIKEITKQLDEMQPAAGPNPAAAEPEPKPQPRPK